MKGISPPIKERRSAIMNQLTHTPIDTPINTQLVPIHTLNWQNGSKGERKQTWMQALYNGRIVRNQRHRTHYRELWMEVRLNSIHTGTDHLQQLVMTCMAERRLRQQTASEVPLQKHCDTYIRSWYKAFCTCKSSLCTTAAEVSDEEEEEAEVARGSRRPLTATTTSAVLVKEKRLRACLRGIV